MPKFCRIAMLFFSLNVWEASFAQNLTGIWEGIMFDEYLKLNIIQHGNLLCGYTFDFVLKDKKSYCKTYFTGNYNPKEGIWELKGNSFLVNSGDHELMTLKFWRSPQGNKNLLKGMVANESSFFNFLDAETGNAFWIKKVSSKPQSVPGHENICSVTEKKNNFKEKQKLKEYTYKHNKDLYKTDYLRDCVEKQTETKPFEMIVINENKNTEINISSIKTIDSSENILVTKVNSRKNILFSKISTSSREIEIRVYDNGIVDNDTVSILFNGIPIKTKSRLTEEALVVKLTLNPEVRHNELILFAENLGGIPPNSAFIIVKSGTKRYEIHANANLNENALLTFEYQE